MLSCARGFAGLYSCDDRAPLLQAHLRALPGGGRPAGEAMEPAHRPAAVEEGAPLQRAGHRARGGERRDALAAPQGAGTRRGGAAARDRRATHPGRIPPDRQGSRARTRHRRTRALGRAVDVADRIFLETTRRFAPARLAREDVSTALTLVQVEPGKPIADLGCGYGRHLAAFVEQGHAHPLGVDRSALLLDEARAQAPSAHLLRGDLRALPLHAGSLAAAFCFYRDRKSTRLNSSHLVISYAVFCLKKKTHHTRSAPFHRLPLDQRPSSGVVLHLAVISGGGNDLFTSWF